MHHPPHPDMRKAPESSGEDETQGPSATPAKERTAMLLAPYDTPASLGRVI